MLSPYFPGCHLWDPDYFEKMVRAFAAGGAHPDLCGTSSLRFVRKLWVVCEDERRVPLPRDEGTSLHVQCALGFYLGPQRSEKEWGSEFFWPDVLRGDEDDITRGRIRRCVPLHPRRLRSSDGYIHSPVVEDGGLDLGDKVAVRSALHDVIDTSYASDHVSRAQRIRMAGRLMNMPVLRIASALCMIAPECEEAARRIEVTLERRKVEVEAPPTRWMNYHGGWETVIVYMCVLYYTMRSLRSADTV